MIMRSIVKSLTLDKWELPMIDSYFIVAGPCSAESRKQILMIAKTLVSDGISFMRAGAWKPRTFPGSFEGFGEEALDWLVEAREQYKIEIGTEVGLPRHVEECLKKNIHLVWIGTRTTASPFAVQELANAMKGTNMSVLVKNPICPDVKLWVGAIERIYMAGIDKLIAIHRGFSTTYKSTYRFPPIWRLAEELKRYLPDIPIICDPSHICGNIELIERVAGEALKRQYDGLMFEVHDCPELALTDNAQQLTPVMFQKMIKRLTKSTHKMMIK
jgi:chorismate mutase